MTQYPLDGVHLDSAQLPSSDFDYARDAVALFRDEIAPSLSPEERRLLDGRAAIDPVTYPDAFPAQSRRRIARAERVRATVRGLTPRGAWSCLVETGRLNLLPSIGSGCGVSQSEDVARA